MLWTRPSRQKRQEPLRWIAENRLKRELESLEGVAVAQVRGGLEEEIRVHVDPERLSALKGEGSNALARLLGVSPSTTSRWETPHDFGWHAVELGTRDELLRDLLIGSETVMLVEDEEAVRSLASEILRSCGYTVIEAANGIDALAKFEDSGAKVELLITDIVMPEMGGRELSEQIKSDRPDIKVLFTSGYTDDAILRHGIIDEGTNFLQKPFTPNVLAQKVREVLDGAKVA